jgi:cob(I)alamin adenosyltransferase
MSRPKFIAEIYLIGMIETAEREKKKCEDLILGSPPGTDNRYNEGQIKRMEENIAEYQKELAELSASIAKQGEG